MKVLLDECIPRKYRRELPGHEVSTVPEAGWADIKNGALLRLAEPIFDVFVTIDGNLTHQQNLHSPTLRIIALSAPNNAIETLSPLAPSVIVAVQSMSPGEIVRISA